MFSSRLARLISAGCACVLFAGCAVSKPDSSPQPSASPSSAIPTESSPTPSDPSPMPTVPSSSPSSNARDGVKFQVPEGYENATGILNDTTGSTIAYLRDATGNGIYIRVMTSNYPDMKSFIEPYVKALNAGEETVTNQRMLTIAGMDGAELTFKSKLDDRISTLFVTIKNSHLYMVSGVTPDGPTRQAVEKVAMSLTIA